VLRPTERKGVLVRIPTPDEALVWEADGVKDYPQVPDRVTSAAEAVKLAKDAQKPAPTKGSVTLRGTWTGMYTCADGQPRIQLKRKLATYGTLFLTSSPDGGWEWEFQRSAKWFTGEKTISGYGGETLLEALQQAVLAAMQPVGEACSFRDTHRHREHDDEWAKKHPIKARQKKVPKDPIERLKEPKPKKARKPRKNKPDAPATVAPKPATRKKPSAGVSARKKPATTGTKPRAAAEVAKPVPAPKKRKAPKKPVRKPASTARATAKGDAVAPKKPSKVPCPKKKKPSEPKADADKDKALLAAFSQAIAQAVKGAA